MERLDQAYLSDLVRRAGRGGSNAFAELFAATAPRLYGYLCRLDADAETAQELLKETYKSALLALPALRKEVLFLPYLARTASRLFHEGAAGDEDPLRMRLMNLPLTESQMLLMRYTQGLSEQEIGEVLNMSRHGVHRTLRTGLRHLRRGEGEEFPKAPSGRPRREVPALPASRMTALLAEIFEECGQEPNTVPMEALSAYTVYRRERFSLQRGILAAGLVFFLLLPLLFILPEYEVTGGETGIRGLPVYTVDIHSLLPVERVTARLKSHGLPVYEAGAKVFTVEPTRNGEMVVTVMLANRQSVRKQIRVDGVDAEGPRLKDTEIGEDYLLLTVEDAGIGVDYREICAVSASGAVITPAETDPERGTVRFDYPTENWDVYIPDHIGNTLHLAITFEQEADHE